MAIILLTLLIGLTLAAPAHAEGEQPSALPGALPGDIAPSKNVDVPDSGGSFGFGLDYLLSLPFRGLARAIMAIPGFQSIDQLVFNESSPGHPAPEMGGVFYNDEWNRLIVPWYKRFLAIALAPELIAVVIMILGYRTVLNSGNPRQMVSMQETAWNILAGLMLVVFGPLLLSQLLALNSAIVGFVKGALAGQGLVHAGQSITLGAIQTQSPLLDSLIQLAFAGLMLQLNFMYLVRKFVLAVLIVIMPIVGWAWVSRSTRTPMLILLSEVVTNALMSASHAIVLAVYFALTQYDGAGMFSTWWAKLFGLVLVIPVAALLRRMIAGWLNILGINEEKWAALGALGIGGLVGLSHVVGGTVGAFGGMVGNTVTNGSHVMRGAGSAAPALAGAAAGGFRNPPGGPGGPGGPSGGLSGSGVVEPLLAPNGSTGRLAAGSASLQFDNDQRSAGLTESGPVAVHNGPLAPVGGPTGPGQQGGRAPLAQGPSQQSRRHVLDWDAAERFGGAAGRMMGSVMGLAMGHEAAPAVARFSENLGRLPVAASRRLADIGTGRHTLDGPRWRRG
ncbi:MAG: hypothetical protein ACYC9Q_05405 [Bacillota bacterium]